VKLRRKRVSVIGMAKSGIAAANLAHRLGARVLISELSPRNKHSSAIKRLRRGIKYEFGANSEILLDSDIIIKSPGVPSHIPIIKKAHHNNIPVIGEIEFANQFNPSKNIIAITGTNGKTTTTTLVGAIFKNSRLKTFVGGNIGHPLAETVLSLAPKTVVVLEMSSYQLEDAPTFHPHISAILNITPDHMEHHGSMKNYIAAKSRIFANQSGKDYCILNYDDMVCRALANKCPSQVVFFSRLKKLKQGIWCDNNVAVMKYGKYKCSIPIDFKIPGNHNLENIMAAIAMTVVAGINPNVITKVVKGFEGVEHRIELARELRGVRYINDSKGTNVDSTRVALESFNAPIWLILGGRDKGSPYAPLKPLIKKKVAGILLIGEASPIIKQQLAGAAKMYNCQNMEGALNFASKNAKPGSVVLLSPACASFDQYKNYEARGRHFKSIVKSLR